MAEKEKDWVTPVAVVGGGAALAIGAVMLFKQKGFGPGQGIKCTFSFKHSGPGGDFKFRVVLGHIIGISPLAWFDEEENIPNYLQESVGLVAASNTFEEKQAVVYYKVPKILRADKYDLEASIRYMDGSIVPGMRVMADDIVIVKE